MNCSSCGKPLAQGARFCSGCGAQEGFAPPPPSLYPLRTRCPRVARNLQPLGTLWLVYAALRLLTGLAAFVFLHGIFGSHLHGGFDYSWTPLGRHWPSAILPVAFASLLVSVSCAALTGYALLTRQPWGRIAPSYSVCSRSSTSRLAPLWASTRCGRSRQPAAALSTMP